MEVIAQRVRPQHDWWLAGVLDLPPAEPGAKRLLCEPGHAALGRHPAEELKDVGNPWRLREKIHQPRRPAGHPCPAGDQPHSVSRARAKTTLIIMSQEF